MKTMIVAAAFAALFMAAGARAAAPAPADYQDWWWDPSKDGMGVNIGQQGDTLAVAWYRFAADRSSTYNLLSGKLVNGVLTGLLQTASGPPPGPGYNPAEVLRGNVGSATFRFTSPTSAVFEYTLNGSSGVLNLVRFTMQGIPLEGSWQYASIAARASCLFPASQGQIANSGFATMEKTGPSPGPGPNPNPGSGPGHYRLITQSNIGLDSCTYNMTLAQSGSLYTGDGTFVCISGRGGAITVERLQAENGFLSLVYTSRYSIGESCTETGRLSAALFGSFDATGP